MLLVSVATYSRAIPALDPTLPAQHLPTWQHPSGSPDMLDYVLIYVYERPTIDLIISYAFLMIEGQLIQDNSLGTLVLRGIAHIVIMNRC